VAMMGTHMEIILWLALAAAVAPLVDELHPQ
jgi:hypothetical protein